MKLADLAPVIRSKNASPFITVLDVFFDSEAAYWKVVQSGVLSTANIAKLYRIPEGDVLGVYQVHGCLGIKVAYLKPKPSDDIRAGDVYGAQQNAPLLAMDIP